MLNSAGPHHAASFLDFSLFSASRSGRRLQPAALRVSNQNQQRKGSFLYFRTGLCSPAWHHGIVDSFSKQPVADAEVASEITDAPPLLGAPQRSLSL